jgi:hypothetical protein
MPSCPAPAPCTLLHLWHGGDRPQGQARCPPNRLSALSKTIDLDGETVWAMTVTSRPRRLRSMDAILFRASILYLARSMAWRSSAPSRMSSQPASSARLCQRRSAGPPSRYLLGSIVLIDLVSFVSRPWSLYIGSLIEWFPLRTR